MHKLRILPAVGRFSAGAVHVKAARRYGLNSSERRFWTETHFSGNPTYRDFEGIEFPAIMVAATKTYR
jgi:hypothetical protein